VWKSGRVGHAKVLTGLPEGVSLVKSGIAIDSVDVLCEKKEATASGKSSGKEGGDEEREAHLRKLESVEIRVGMVRALHY